jgi:uncharacterized protein
MKGIRLFSHFAVFFLLFLFSGKSFAEEMQIPAPVGDIFVQDFANVLNEQEKNELIRLGTMVEEQTTAQIAVLTVDTTGGVPMAEYANAAFRQYGIGREKENNGVLLVLAMNDRQIRIEVGYGLEGRITDGKAGRILDEYATPFLQNGQLDRAIIETYKVLANEVLAEYGKEGQQPSEAAQPIPHEWGEGIPIPSWMLIIIIVVVLFLDFKFFGGFLTQLLFSIILRGGGRGGGSGGGFRGGGGGSSGGGGAGRGW